jgi:hypothetical protein
MNKCSSWVIGVLSSSIHCKRNRGGLWECYAVAVHIKIEGLNYPSIDDLILVGSTSYDVLLFVRGVLRGGVFTRSLICTSSYFLCRCLKRNTALGLEAKQVQIYMTWDGMIQIGL